MEVVQIVVILEFMNIIVVQIIWTQLGQNIDGEAVFDYSKQSIKSVSLNSAIKHSCY